MYFYSLFHWSTALKVAFIFTKKKYKFLQTLTSGREKSISFAFYKPVHLAICSRE